MSEEGRWGVLREKSPSLARGRPFLDICRLLWQLCKLPAVSHHTFIFFQSRDCLDICVHLNVDHKIKTENKTKPQCFMGNRDTPERQTWLVGYLFVFPTLSQQVSIPVFGHYPKESFSLPSNSSHLPLHFTKKIYFRLSNRLFNKEKMKTIQKTWINRNVKSHKNLIYSLTQVMPM